MTPTEKYSANVKIGHRKGSGTCGPQCAPLELGVEEKAGGEGDKDRSRQQTRTTIDIVIVVLIITIREHEGHHQVDASGEVEHGVVKQLFHDYFLIRFFLFLAAKLQKNIQKGCVKFENGV